MYRTFVGLSPTLLPRGHSVLPKYDIGLLRFPSRPIESVDLEKIGLWDPAMTWTQVDTALSKTEESISVGPIPAFPQDTQFLSLPPCPTLC